MKLKPKKATFKPKRALSLFDDKKSEKSENLIYTDLESQLMSRSSLQSEINHELADIKKEIGQYQFINSELRKKFNGKPVFETSVFRGSKITFVLESDQEGNLISSQYLEFENLENKGKEINFLSWIKGEKNK